MLDASVTGCRLLTLPPGQERDTAQMVAMALLSDADFAQHFAFDYQIIAQKQREQLALVFYCPQEVLREVEAQGFRLRRAATVYDGLAALAAYSGQAQAGFGGVFFWEGERLQLLVLSGRKPLYAQTLAGVQTAEQAAQEYGRTVNALSRQYDWPLAGWQTYGLVAVGAEDERLKKQLAVLLEQPVHWLDEEPLIRGWQLPSRYLPARALLEEE